MWLGWGRCRARRRGVTRLTAGWSAVGDREYRRLPATAPPAVHVQRWWVRLGKRVSNAPEPQIPGTPEPPKTGKTDTGPSLRATRPTSKPINASLATSKPINASLATSKPINASLETTVCSRDTPSQTPASRETVVSLTPQNPEGHRAQRRASTATPSHHHTSNSNTSPTYLHPCPSPAHLTRLTETMTSPHPPTLLPAQGPPLASSRLSRVTSVSSLSSLSSLSSISSTKTTVTKTTVRASTPLYRGRGRSLETLESLESLETAVVK